MSLSASPNWDRNGAHVDLCIQIVAPLVMEQGASALDMPRCVSPQFRTGLVARWQFMQANKQPVVYIYIYIYIHLHISIYICDWLLSHDFGLASLADDN